MATAITVPSLESELSSAKLTPSARARLIAAGVADVTKRAAEKAAEARQKALKRSKMVQERLRRPVPLSIGAVLGGAAAEVVRRKLVGRFASNLYAQALGVALVGAGAQFLEEKVGIPGVGSLGVGHMGAAGMIAACKLHDSNDPERRDPVALALEGTTEKARRDRERRNREKAEEK